MNSFKKPNKRFTTIVTACLMLPLSSLHSFGNTDYKWENLKKSNNTSLSPKNTQANYPGLLGSNYQDNQKEIQYSPNQIIVKLKEVSGQPQNSALAPKKTHILDDLENRFGLSVEKNVFAQLNSPSIQTTKESTINSEFSNIYLMNTNNGNVLDIVRKLSKESDIEYAEPNYIYKIHNTPNDPFYSSIGAWGQTFDDLWGLKTINSLEAWSMSLGKDVIVAVIDTGLDRNHADIAANVWNNPKEILGNNIDDDGNGFIDDKYGWNFAENDNNLTDYNGHGTHVAGTVAATINNNIGIVGVAPKTKILAIKGFGRSGNGSNADLANALVYAADIGADVINNSWGGPGASKLIHEAIKYAHKKNSVIVSSAGNSSKPTSQFTPAGLPESITVTGIDANIERYSASNWGTRIDVTAPAVDVLSLLSSDADTRIYPPVKIIDNQYLAISGTSMAAPHVAGQIALMLSLEPDLKPNQIRYILHNSSTDIGKPGFDITFGNGVIDAKTSLQLVDELEDDAPNLYASITLPQPGSIIGKKMTFSGSVAGADIESYTLEWKINDPENINAFTTLLSEDDDFNTEIHKEFDSSIFPENKEIMMRLSAFDEDGNKIVYRTIFFVDRSLEPGWPQKSAPITNRGGFDTSETFADLDNDGQVEIISTIGDSITVYDIQGNRLPGFPIIFNRPISSMVSVGDIDNDGFDEIIVPLIGTKGKNATLHAINYDGSSVIGYPLDYTHLPGDDNNETVISQAPILADVDNDGEIEIVIGVRQWPLNFETEQQRQQLAILNTNGEPEKGWPIEVSQEFSYFGGTMAAVDYENDGDMEIAVIGNVNKKSHLSVYEHNGTKRFGIDIGLINTFSKIIFEDITKDGHYELLSIGANKDFTPIIIMVNDQGKFVDGWPQNIHTHLGVEPFTIITDEKDNKYIMAIGHQTFNYYTPDGKLHMTKPVQDTEGRLHSSYNDLVRIDHHGSKHGTQAFFISGGSGGLLKYDLWGTPLYSKRTESFAKAPVIGDIDNDNIIEIAAVTNEGITYLWEDTEHQEEGDIIGWLTSGANNSRTFSVKTPYSRDKSAQLQK